MLSCIRGFQRKLGPALALACLLCCATVAQTVRTSHAPGVDFAKYHTYKWVEVKGQHPDPSVDAQIKQSIDAQLPAKGLTKADGTADLNVDYQTAISKAQHWEAYEDWTDTSFGGERLPQHRQVTIEVGTLVLDMYDATAKHLVWTGRAHKTIEPSSSPKDRQKNLDKALKVLLADFPPK